MQVNRIVATDPIEQSDPGHIPPGDHGAERLAYRSIASAGKLTGRLDSAADARACRPRRHVVDLRPEIVTTRKVEAIRAEHPALFDRVKREAHAQALGSLVLAGPYAELEAVQAEEAALARRKKRAQRAMLATLKGVPVEEVSDSFGVRYGGELPLPAEAAEAIGRRQATHQRRLLADDRVGRQVAGLEAEKDNLLDMIWLATSPAQIRTLWAKDGALLGDEPTGLEREALGIEPMEEG